MIQGLDHLVLTVRDLDATCRFYHDVLGMEIVSFGHGRVALQFGEQKINLHQAGHEIEPHALRPLPGSTDLCLLTGRPPADIVAHIESRGGIVELGPVTRTGATGEITSIYLRDPDGNLLEIGCLRPETG